MPLILMKNFNFFFAPIFPINRKAAISHIFSLELPKFKCNNGSKQVQILINITVEMRIKTFFYLNNVKKNVTK